MTPDQAIDLLDFEKTECFAPLDGKTHCNSAAKCVCACLGIYLPAVVANDQHDYLAGSGDWLEVDAETAARYAAFNGTVLASWKNPTGGHGHIMTLRSSSSPGAIRVGGAGGHNFSDAPLEESFGLSIHPTFFHHQGV